MSTDPIVYAVIFLAVLFIIEGIYLLFFGKSIRLNSRMNRRIALLEKGDSRQTVLEQLRKECDQHRGGSRIPLYSYISKKAARANLAFTPQQIFMLMGGLTAFAFIGLTVGTQASIGVRFGLSVGIGIGAVIMWINKKAGKRIAAFEEQLPEAVELMVRSLRVGHPFSNAVSIVAQEVPDPLGSEFGIIADEVAYGRDMSECLKDMAERIDTQDMRFLAVAVTIQQQSGGNLAEILAGLSKVIRARFRLFRRVKAITAEAKWSGNFLSAFPLLALVGIQLAQPDYYDDVRETVYFMPAAIAVGVFLVVNVVFMRIMVNIKV